MLGKSVELKQWQVLAVALAFLFLLMAVIVLSWRSVDQAKAIASYQQIWAERDQLNARAEIAEAAVQTLTAIAVRLATIDEKLDTLADCDCGAKPKQ